MKSEAFEAALERADERLVDVQRLALVRIVHVIRQRVFRGEILVAVRTEFKETRVGMNASDVVVKKTLVEKRLRARFAVNDGVDVEFKHVTMQLKSIGKILSAALPAAQSFRLRRRRGAAVVASLRMFDLDVLAHERRVMEALVAMRAGPVAGADVMDELAVE